MRRNVLVELPSRLCSQRRADAAAVVCCLLTAACTSCGPPCRHHHLNDMLTDACASCAPYCGGYAHMGMLKAVGARCAVLCRAVPCRAVPRGAVRWRRRPHGPARGGERWTVLSLCLRCAGCLALPRSAIPLMLLADCMLELPLQRHPTHQPPQARWFVKNKLPQLCALCDENPGYGLLLVSGRRRLRRGPPPLPPPPPPSLAPSSLLLLLLPAVSAVVPPFSSTPHPPGAVPSLACLQVGHSLGCRWVQAWRRCWRTSSARATQRWGR